MSDDFSNLGLKKGVLDALASLKFTTPTDVQKEIIPLVLSKKNLAFTSQTGSGKTLGFGLGFFSRINLKQNIQVLVLVPTRELCQQVGDELIRFGDIMGFNVGMLFGGHELVGDRRTISRRLHVVVATPGRLIQHINFKTVDVSGVSVLVFDESDQMFDNGFYEDCVYVKSRISSTAQIILSSATITSKVDIFLKTVVKNFSFVEVGALIPPSIAQDAIFCTIPEKKDLLVKFFEGEDFSRAIVFVNTKAKLNAIFDTLNDRGISAAQLSSDLEQKDREKCLRNFKANKFSVLVCTDIASRGLHIENVDIIVNYDVPSRSEFYVHRIGRTGRNGQKGYALTFVCPEDKDAFDVIIGEFNLNIGTVDTNFELVE